MSCVDEIYLNDIGTSIEFLVKECDDTDPDNPVEKLVDISSATLMTINFLKPISEAKVPVAGSFLTDGTDSVLRYISVDGFFDEIGKWKAQAQITMPTGKWYTSSISFKVLDIL